MVVLVLVAVVPISRATVLVVVLYVALVVRMVVPVMVLVGV